MRSRCACSRGSWRGARQIYNCRLVRVSLLYSLAETCLIGWRCQGPFVWSRIEMMSGRGRISSQNRIHEVRQDEWRARSATNRFRRERLLVISRRSKPERIWSTTSASGKIGISASVTLEQPVIQAIANSPVIAFGSRQQNEGFA